MGVHYVDPDFKPPAYDERKLLYIVQEVRALCRSGPLLNELADLLRSSSRPVQYVCKRGQPSKALLHLLS